MPIGSAGSGLRGRLVAHLDQSSSSYHLDALDDADPERKAPKNISLTDPGSQWTAAPGGPAFYAYSTNYLIDIEAGVIVDVEATRANRIEEVNSTKTMVERVEERFGLKPERLIGDAYGTGEMLGWMVDEKGYRAACTCLGQEPAPGRYAESLGLQVGCRS